jgi:chromate transport protein ChrA
MAWEELFRRNISITTALATVFAVTVTFYKCHYLLLIILNNIIYAYLYAILIMAADSKPSPFEEANWTKRALQCVIEAGYGGLRKAVALFLTGDADGASTSTVGSAFA